MSYNEICVFSAFMVQYSKSSQPSTQRNLKLMSVEINWHIYCTLLNLKRLEIAFGNMSMNKCLFVFSLVT